MTDGHRRVLDAGKVRWRCLARDGSKVICVLYELVQRVKRAGLLKSLA